MDANNNEVDEKITLNQICVLKQPYHHEKAVNRVCMWQMDHSMFSDDP